MSDNKVQWKIQVVDDTQSGVKSAKDGLTEIKNASNEASAAMQKASAEGMGGMQKASTALSGAMKMSTGSIGGMATGARMLGKAMGAALGPIGLVVAAGMALYKAFNWVVGKARDYAAAIQDMAHAGIEDRLAKTTVELGKQAKAFDDVNRQIQTTLRLQDELTHAQRNERDAASNLFRHEAIRAALDLPEEEREAAIKKAEEDAARKQVQNNAADKVNDLLESQTRKNARADSNETEARALSDRIFGMELDKRLQDAKADRLGAMKGETAEKAHGKAREVSENLGAQIEAAKKRRDELVHEGAALRESAGADGRNAETAKKEGATALADFEQNLALKNIREQEDARKKAADERAKKDMERERKIAAFREQKAHEEKIADANDKVESAREKLEHYKERSREAGERLDRAKAEFNDPNQMRDRMRGEDREKREEKKFKTRMDEVVARAEKTKGKDWMESDKLSMRQRAARDFLQAGKDKEDADNQVKEQQKLVADMAADVKKIADDFRELMVLKDT